MNGQATIFLQAENFPVEEGRSLREGGLTPQAVGNNAIYLASDVPVATIVHEFGHQVDQAFGLGLSARISDLAEQDVLPRRQFITSGFAAIEDIDSPQEVFPDWFMTEMLDRRGHPAPGGEVVEWARKQAGTLTDNATDAQLLTEVLILVETSPGLDRVQFKLNDGTTICYSKGGNFNVKTDDNPC
jgi:hypothetical protein